MGAHIHVPPPIIERVRSSRVLCASCDRQALYRVTRHDWSDGTTTCERHLTRWTVELGRPRKMTTPRPGQS